MVNSKKVFDELLGSIEYSDSAEAKQILYVVFERLFNFSKTDIIAGKPLHWNTEVADQIQEIITRLNQYEPIQYILGEAHFYERVFTVTPDVLIPRPETEELVKMVADYCEQDPLKHATILDIGTGSGCIAITLSLALHSATVLATDVSREALTVAKANAEKLKGHVGFIEHDILKDPLPVDTVDVIVSNPPYISNNEKVTMGTNVVKYEPHIALFVPDSDPLIFYRIIARKAFAALSLNGLLAVEINQRFGKEVRDIFETTGYHAVEIVKDVAGNDRFVRGIKTKK